MNIVDESRFRPFGCGRAAPIGSIADAALDARLSAYKRNVAGQYQSVPPDEIHRKVPPGVHIVSPKIDGEQWFVYSDGGGSTMLLSPTGRAITGIPLTDEAARIIGGRRILVAGELFANGKPGRPRVHDVVAALGGGTDADVERLKFAPFDLLQNGNEDACRLPFQGRVELLRGLFSGSVCLRPVDFRRADGADAVAALFDEWVTRGGAEGIVVRCADGRILKIKPEITIDAAIVGFSETGCGIGRLLLALMRPDGKFQLIGSVGTGFTDEERAAFHRALSGDPVPAAYRKATPEGALYRFVRPRIVVEVKCNDLLTHRSDGSAIRRMALNYSDEKGWTPIRNVPSVSMINAVFLRIREDKTVEPVAIRFSQVTDIAPVEDTGTDTVAGPMPAPLIVRREVYSKTTGDRRLIRKLVVWKTNRETADPLWPQYIAFFTDFAPGRKEPLKTELRVASSLETIQPHVDEWLAANIKCGWELVSDAIVQPVSKVDVKNARLANFPVDTIENDSAASPSETAEFASPEILGDQIEKDRGGLPGEIKLDASGTKQKWAIGVAFPHSSSANFAVALRRAKTLALFGNLESETDDKGRQARFTLTIDSAIVENAVKIENLVRVVSKWRCTELSINGEPVSLFEFDSFLEEISNLRRCLRRHGGRQAHSGGLMCVTDSPLGCRRLRIEPNQKFLKFLNHSDMPWFAVGAFDGKTVRIDKQALRAQVNNTKNERLELCPLFDRDVVIRHIEKLPDALDPSKDKRWVIVYSRDTGKPVWALPRKHSFLPHDLMFAPREKPEHNIVSPILLGENAKKDAPPRRRIPSVRFSDVRGQNAAVEAVRDCVELPLRHAALFERVGVRGGGGILLYGPPGNGKTLLAKAVAGETSAHIEIVSGPEILSKWAGESERALRAVFERARQHAPSVILFDEIDAIAPARDAADAVHQKILVSQLLVLLDGLEARGRVFVIATTNRPNDIDPALKRPGRLDRLVYVGPPDAAGRTAIFERYILTMRVSAAIRPAELAAATPGFSGAQIEYACREAGLLCIKEALRTGAPFESVEILPLHFNEAISAIRQPPETQFQGTTAALVSFLNCTLSGKTHADLQKRRCDIL
ncbi:MAG TPA: AAA family ATPase [bacterium]|nr:AAA family ATPase [bacterium]